MTFQMLCKNAVDPEVSCDWRRFC